jgi:hypothetical protein
MVASLEVTSRVLVRKLMAATSEVLCPRCGAPMPPPSVVRSQRCEFCRVLLAPAGNVWRPTLGDDDDTYGDHREPRLWIGGHRYALIGLIARGEASDVFLGRRDESLGARVVIKVLRSHAHEGRLAHERRVLETLAHSTAQGAPHFTRLMPEPVAFGTARLGMNGRDGARTVAIHRYRVGFAHTFDDVRRAHGDALEPAHAVWMWKRVLESLGFLHASGFVHGAVLPAHLLVHSVDHGVVLAGFSRAVRPGEALPAFSRDARAFYPDDVHGGAAASIRTDLAMSARAMLHVLGGDPLHAPTRVPAPFARLLETTAVTPWANDAWALVDDAKQIARDVFGPPKFVPFEMPRS